MTIETDKAAILKLLEGVRKAHQAKNAEAIVSHYAKDAVIFDLSPPLLSRHSSPSHIPQNPKVLPWMGSAPAPPQPNRDRQ